MGRRFYEGTMPDIVDSLKRIADALDEDEQRRAGRGALSESERKILDAAVSGAKAALPSVVEIDLAMDELTRQGQGTARDRPYAILMMVRRLVAK